MLVGTDVTWTPEYSPWRHGGWYVTNISYPSGAVGCVSRNYPDGKWRIVAETERPDSFPGGQNDHTYRHRDSAARAERALIEEDVRRKQELDHSALRSVIHDLAAAFGDEELGHDVGGHMTCSEADIFAMTIAVGLQEVEHAARFLVGHASFDGAEDGSHGWFEDYDAEGYNGPGDNPPDPRYDDDVAVLEAARTYVRKVLLGEDS